MKARAPQPSRIPPKATIHLLGLAGMGVCGAREFVTPGSHKFVAQKPRVTCKACKATPLKAFAGTAW